MINIKNIHRRIEADIAKITAMDALNADTIIATWREQVGGAPAANPLFGSQNAAIVHEDVSLEFKALVHTVGDSGTRTHFFKEFKAGDIIIDYPASTGNFEGKKNIRFQYQGRYYVPKVVGKEVVDAWDTSSNNAGIRSLLLTIQS
jgi:hypothetical protein